MTRIQPPQNEKLGKDVLKDLVAYGSSSKFSKSLEVEARAKEKVEKDRVRDKKKAKRDRDKDKEEEHRVDRSYPAARLRSWFGTTCHSYIIGNTVRR